MRQPTERVLTAKWKRSDRRRVYLNVLDQLIQEKWFILLVIGGVLLAYYFTSFGVAAGQAAMWLGFAFAAYSTVANDSIQSLGTFIESNKHRQWWILWAFTGFIFLCTVAFSWFYFDGDVTYQRLTKPDGSTAYPHPSEFSFFQVIAPLVLLVLTRLRMPVSTTFLLLSVFSANTSGITSMIGKSLSGYGMAFVLSFLVWYFSYDTIRKFFKGRETHAGWTVAQWLVSGTLWAVWVMQDGANIAVFLPRQQTGTQFLIFATTIFFGLGLLFYLRGDKIQRIVSEKVRISDVRAATLIDATYVLLLIYKLFISTVPLSTTWVFLGVIGGREIAVNLARVKQGKKHKRKAMRVIFRDLTYALIGLAVSFVLAAAAVPGIRASVIEYFRDLF